MRLKITVASVLPQLYVLMSSSLPSAIDHRFACTKPVAKSQGFHCLFKPSHKEGVKKARK